MPVYEHFNEARRAETLPNETKIGVCLTCKYWEVEQERSKKLTAEISLCLQPQLKSAALLVSGSSACNLWSEKSGVAAEAKAYAEQGK